MLFFTHNLDLRIILVLVSVIFKLETAYYVQVVAGFCANF